MALGVMLLGNVEQMHFCQRALRDDRIAEQRIAPHHILARNRGAGDAPIVEPHAGFEGRPGHPIARAGEIVAELQRPKR